MWVGNSQVGKCIFVYKRAGTASFELELRLRFILE